MERELRARADTIFVTPSPETLASFRAGMMIECCRSISGSFLGPGIVVVFERIEIKNQPLALFGKFVVDQPADGRSPYSPKRAVFEVSNLRVFGSSAFFTAYDLAGIDDLSRHDRTIERGFPKHRRFIQFFLSPNIRHQNLGPL